MECAMPRAGVPGACLLLVAHLVFFFCAAGCGCQGHHSTDVRPAPTITVDILMARLA
jgi:hypothetical protein